MNDYLEIEHGLTCLAEAYKGDHGIRLKSFIDKKFPGLSVEIEQNFNAWQHGLRHETFVTCLSEHAGPGLEKEDEHGRLSMWRAYGRRKGVAMVVNQAPIWMTSTALGLFTSPVAYLDPSRSAATGPARKVMNALAASALLAVVGTLAVSSVTF